MIQTNEPSRLSYILNGSKVTKLGIFGNSPDRLELHRLLPRWQLYIFAKVRPEVIFPIHY